MPLHPSGRSWEVSREDVHVIKVIGKGAFTQVAQATVKNVRASQEETTAAFKTIFVLEARITSIKVAEFSVTLVGFLII